MSLPVVPDRLAPLSGTERDLILAAVEQAHPQGMAWAEKIRRFASLAGRNLSSAAAKRFGAEASGHVDWAETLLLVAAGQPSSAGAPVDQAMLNAALYCADARGRPVHARARAMLTDLESWLVETEPVPVDPPAMGPEHSGAVRHWAAEARDAAGIVLICPSPLSLVSLSVFRILRALDIPVAAVVLRRFTLARLRQEARRDGARLIRKIWRKLILRADENPDSARIALSTVCARLGDGPRDIRKAAREADVPVVEVAELEDAAPALGQLGGRLGIFTGGGMVRQALLDALPQGIVNVHMGSLPQHKGMDVVQAPILEGCFGDIALTGHLMEARLDRGPVLARATVSSDGYATLGSLRNEIAAVAPILAVEAALGRLSGRLVPIVQPEAGRQYYFVHPQLVEVIARVLAARSRRTLAPGPVGIVERFFDTYPGRHG